MEHSKKVAAAIPAKTPEERRSNAEKAWRTKKTKADSLLQTLLNSPTPEIEPPKRKPDLSDLLPRRRSDTPAPPPEYTLPTGTEADDDQG